MLSLLYVCGLVFSTRFQSELSCTIMCFFCRAMLSLVRISVLVGICHFVLVARVVVHEVHIRNRTVSFCYVRRAGTFFLWGCFSFRLYTSSIGVKSCSSPCTSKL